MSHPAKTESVDPRIVNTSFVVFNSLRKTESRLATYCHFLLGRSGCSFVKHYKAVVIVISKCAAGLDENTAEKIS